MIESEYIWVMNMAIFLIFEIFQKKSSLKVSMLYLQWILDYQKPVIATLLK